MATLEGIVPSNVQDQLRLIEEISSAPVDELRPLLAIVLATFLVERRTLEMPFMFVDAIDAVLRKIREQGKMALEASAAGTSPLLQAVEEHRQWVSDQQDAGLMARPGENTNPEPSETAYQPPATAT